MVEFSDSLQPSDLYKHVKKQNYWLKSDSEAVNLFNDSFSKLYSKTPETTEIPRIIHFIWLGKKQIPESFTTKLLPQWKEKHPTADGYRIKLWGEEDLTDTAKLEGLELANANIILDKELNPALRADFLRLELLYHFGGVYADVDMTCQQCIQQLLSQKGQFISCVSNT